MTTTKTKAFTTSKRNIPSDVFDPSDLVQTIPTKISADGSIEVTGTGELVNEQKTTDAMYSPDTMGDPQGSEARASNNQVALPDFYFKRFDLDDLGRPTFKQSIVDGIINMLVAKLANNYEPTDKVKADGKIVADGLIPLLEVDPQATGLNFLQLVTKTWGEFISNAYEYQIAADALSEKTEMPDYLLERETKMVDLASKARILDYAVSLIDNKFGLATKTLTLNVAYVKKQIEYRQQRLAEYTYKKNADSGRRNASHLNDATIVHAQNIVASL